MTNEIGTNEISVHSVNNVKKKKKLWSSDFLVYCIGIIVKNASLDTDKIENPLAISCDRSH